MKIPIFQVDAFTSELFKGNPAAVCPLERWLPDNTMQEIAKENNLSETAFFINKNNTFDIRWFTPVSELDLAGHPTLATAHVIIKELNFKLHATIQKVTDDLERRNSFNTVISSVMELLNFLNDSDKNQELPHTIKQKILENI